MDLYRSLFELAKLLLAEPSGAPTAQALLLRLLEAAEARRGFLVVREGAGYEQKFDVRYDRRRTSAEERSFSRSLVRRVVETREPIDSANLPEDPRFSGLDSVRALGPCAVLAVPLLAGGEVWGVLYLERPGAGERFSEAARALVAEFAEVAGLFLQKALEQERLRQRTQSLERGLFARHRFPGIVTAHPRMLELLELVAQVADSDAPILLLGETGTGKELVAQALHLNSSRASKPFAPLHCAALGASVLESELFGHARGAFTGAERERRGRIAAAEGGTLFLDEVAEIPLEVQAKLLRFVQFGELQRVGADQTEQVDVRVLAATHQDLGALVRAGSFRQDLYFRLKAVELRLPALRERKSDIPLLAAHFLREHWKRRGEPPRWSARAEQALQSYAWPGNVRELEHVVQRACLLARGPEMDTDLLPPELGPPAPALFAGFTELTNAELKTAREQAVDALEQSFVTALLERHGGNVTHAAEKAGMQRSYLQKLLARHRPSSRTDP